MPECIKHAKQTKLNEHSRSHGRRLTTERRPEQAKAVKRGIFLRKPSDIKYKMDQASQNSAHDTKEHCPLEDAQTPGVSGLQVPNDHREREKNQKNRKSL